MKKILILLLTLLCFCGCDAIGKKKVDSNQKYLTIIENINEHDTFLDASNYYDIEAEVAKIDGGYRYYVTIDNPRNALYDVEAVAIEKGVDYKNTMAANVGIFEESEYTMIPNQANPDKGYVAGLVISGVSENPDVTLYVYVSFKNKDMSVTHSEYFKLEARYEGL